MKHYFYTFPYVFIFLMAALIPDKLTAQCNCNDGSPATPITYTVKMDSSTLAKVKLTFPQFDPSIGTLACIVLKDTTSGVSTTHVRNTAPQDLEYKFRLTISTGLSGPGFSVDDAFDKIYGPDTLRKYTTPGDSIVYGPDSIFKGITHIAFNNWNVVPYMGNGTIDLEYEISGGMVSLKGGLNYENQVTTYTWGIFNLTYYWCPNSLLARNISYFTAIKKDHNIQLHWNVNNEEATNIYEIQISYDGRHFVRVGQTTSQYAGEGATAEYHYEHLLKQAAAGKLYFRIQQKDLQGKTRYSPIRVVNVEENGAAGVMIYPNPVQRKVSLQFDRLLNSQFAIDIINASGQVLLQRVIKANNTSLLQFELTNPVAPGVYYLRARDMATQQTYLNKLLIQ
jgi:hypothetical protein